MSHGPWRAALTRLDARAGRAKAQTKPERHSTRLDMTPSTVEMWLLYTRRLIAGRLRSQLV